MLKIITANPKMITIRTYDELIIIQHTDRKEEVVTRQPLNVYKEPYKNV